MKKQRSDMKAVTEAYNNIKSKLKDQARLMDKIRNNSHARHTSRSASKKREMDIVSKKHFTQFIELLSDTFDISFGLHEDAF